MTRNNDGADDEVAMVDQRIIGSREVMEIMVTEKAKVPPAVVFGLVDRPGEGGWVSVYVVPTLLDDGFVVDVYGYVDGDEVFKASQMPVRRGT